MDDDITIISPVDFRKHRDSPPQSIVVNADGELTDSDDETPAKKGSLLNTPFKIPKRTAAQVQPPFKAARKITFSTPTDDERTTANAKAIAKSIKKHRVEIEDKLLKELDMSCSPEPEEVGRKRSLDRREREERRRKTSRISIPNHNCSTSPRQQGMTSTTFVETKGGMREEVETKPRPLSKYILFRIAR